MNDVFRVKFLVMRQAWWILSFKDTRVLLSSVMVSCEAERLADLSKAVNKQGRRLIIMLRSYHH